MNRDLRSQEGLKNQPIVTLRFTPTDVVAVSTATVAPAMTTDPAEVLVEDGRLLADKRVLGDRSTDDDKLVTLTSSEDVLPYLQSTVERLAQQDKHSHRSLPLAQRCPLPRPLNRSADIRIQLSPPTGHKPRPTGEYGCGSPPR